MGKKQADNRTLLRMLITLSIPTVFGRDIAYILIWMGAEEAVQRPASIYFTIVSLPMIFRSAGIILGAAIRGTKDTRTPMFISIGSNCLNAVLNYLLIYTAGLGVTGAAIASAVSYTVSGALMFIAYRKKEKLHWKWNNFSVDKHLLKECADIGIPVLGMVSKLSIALTIGMMFISGVVLYFISYPLMCLFTPVEEVAALGAAMLKLVLYDCG